MIKRTASEQGTVFRSLMNGVAASSSPPPVHLTTIAGPDQLNAGYVWCDYQGTRVRCQVGSGIDLTTGAHVILAIPLKSGATNEFVMVAYLYGGDNDSRLPPMRVASISDANGDPISGAGTVTSVGLSVAPAGIFDVASTPVTSAGTIALSMDNQNANIVLSGPASGGAAEPSFRSLVADDIPSLTVAKISDIAYQLVRDAGVDMTVRGGINFIAGSNVTLTLSDDAGNDETEVTIASTGGGTADDTLAYLGVFS